MQGRLAALHAVLRFPLRREVTQLMRSAPSHQLVQELLVAFCCVLGAYGRVKWIMPQEGPCLC